MAAKTTSGSGFDPKFRLSAHDFLLESQLVAVYQQALRDFTLECSHYKATQCEISKSDSHFGTKKCLTTKHWKSTSLAPKSWNNRITAVTIFGCILRKFRMLDMPYVSTATIWKSIFELPYLQTEWAKKSKLSTLADCIRYNLTPEKNWARGSRWWQAAAPNMGDHAKNAEKLPPDKCTMPLSYVLEIFPEYLVPKYRSCNPHSNGDIDPRKTQKIVFLPKWRRKLLPVFTSYSDSPWSTWSITLQISKATPQSWQI